MDIQRPIQRSVVNVSIATQRPIPFSDKIYWSYIPEVHYIHKTSKSPLGLSVTARKVSTILGWIYRGGICS